MLYFYSEIYSVDILWSTALNYLMMYFHHLASHFVKKLKTIGLSAALL